MLLSILEEHPTPLCKRVIQGGGGGGGEGSRSKSVDRVKAFPRKSPAIIMSPPIMQRTRQLCWANKRDQSWLCTPPIVVCT